MNETRVKNFSVKNSLDVGMKLKKGQKQEGDVPVST